MPMPRRIMSAAIPSVPPGDFNIIFLSASSAVNNPFMALDAANNKVFIATNHSTGSSRDYVLARCSAADLSLEDMDEIVWGTRTTGTICNSLSITPSGNVIMHGNYIDPANRHYLMMGEFNGTTFANVQSRYIDLGVGGTNFGRWSDSASIGSTLVIAGRERNSMVMDQLNLSDLSLIRGIDTDNAGRWLTRMHEFRNRLYFLGGGTQEAVIFSSDDALVVGARFLHRIEIGAELQNRYDGFVGVGDHVYIAGKMQHSGSPKAYIIKAGWDDLVVTDRSLVDSSSQYYALCTDGTYIFATGTVVLTGNETIIDVYDLNLNKVASYSFSGGGGTTAVTSCEYHNGQIYLCGVTDQSTQPAAFLISFDPLNPPVLPYSPPCALSFTLDNLVLGGIDPALTTSTNIVFGLRTPTYTPLSPTVNDLTPITTGPC